MFEAPLLLTPRLVDKPWGGDRLGTLGRDVAAGARVGESWDVADLTAEQTALPEPVSRVAGGPHEGATLAELVSLDQTSLLGDGVAAAGGRFPLLVKLLDAREPLSVQVHPSDDFPGADMQVKTESWVVLDAEPGAVLHVGLVDGCTPDGVRAAAGTPEVARLLRQVPAKPGDVLHLPAGLVHAVGAGVVIAEVQTPSDTTFRFYDWTEELGREPRELHIDDALTAMELAWDVNAGPLQRPAGQGRLIATDAYTLGRYRLGDGDPLPGGDGRARVLIVLDGALAVRGAADGLTRGGVALLPAACVDAPPAVGSETQVLVASPV